MKAVAFDHATRPAVVETEARLLDVLLQKQIDVHMACGGKGICATCHVYVVNGTESLTPRTAREEKTLRRLRNARSTSRLSCQTRVVGEGVRVALPGGLFVRAMDEIPKLLGRRTRAPLLHPADGRVLVPAGKIITRRAVQALEQVDFDVRCADLV